MLHSGHAVFLQTRGTCICALCAVAHPRVLACQLAPAAILCGPKATCCPSACLCSLQSLVASNLGRDDRRSAAAVFRRTLTLAVSAGVVRLLDACKRACFVIYWHALFISPACPVPGLPFQVRLALYTVLTCAPPGPALARSSAACCWPAAPACPPCSPLMRPSSGKSAR